MGDNRLLQMRLGGWSSTYTLHVLYLIMSKHRYSKKKKNTHMMTYRRLKRSVELLVGDEVKVMWQPVEVISVATRRGGWSRL
jgi:DNA phosphorothioation-dependent restriction protein DptG